MLFYKSPEDDRSQGSAIDGGMNGSIFPVPSNPAFQLQSISVVQISNRDDDFEDPLKGLIFSPGFTERHGQSDVIRHAKSFLGESNCYVTLKDATVVGEVNISTKEYSTVGSAVATLIKKALCFRDKTDRRVLLNHITTAFAPGRLTLVLGPPQSGKSTLLRYVASRLDQTVKDDVEGELLFNNTVVDEANVPRIVAYVPQYDQHNPVLTVEQTLSFAHDCTNATLQKDLLDKGLLKMSMEGGFRPKVEGVLHLFGLKNCKDTILGSGSLRGVSGGERKRVTSAEMAVGMSMVLCMDEISTGLDAAATSDITKSLKDICHSHQMTIIVSLLQPPPDVINIFDDIAVMGKGGNLIYHGPVSQAETYFTEILGFARPSHVDFGDFLVDLCTDGADAKKYYLNDDGPPSCLEMAERWRRSKLYREHIEPVFDKAKELGESGENRVSKEPFTSRFGASFSRLFVLNLLRHLNIVRGDSLFTRQRIFSAIFQGIMLGWIFWQISNDLSRISLLFLLIAMLSGGNLAVVDITAAKRAVFYKQRDANFYPTWAYIAAETISDLPIQVGETILLGTLVYFMAGFQSSEYGIFIVTIFLTTVLFSSIYKAITAHTATASAAQGVAMGILALSFCFSGFLVTHTSMPNYFVWIYWMMPYSWLIRIVALNEFKSSKYDPVVPCGTAGSVQAMMAAANATSSQSWNGAWANSPFDQSPRCACTDRVVATEMQDSKLGNFGQLGWPSGYSYAACRLGDVYLNAFSIQTDSNWIGYGFAYAVGTIFAFLVVYYLGMEHRRLGAERPTVVVKAKSQKTRSNGPHNASDLQDQAAAAEKAFDTLKGLSVQPPEVSLILKDVSYSVSIPVKDGNDRPTSQTEEKQLLNQVCAYFKPGTMTALMGSSGAGKTTLMDVIAGRKTSGSISGEILINGHPQNLETFSRISGYVEQNDIHIPSSTVLEALRFSAFLRLPRELDDNEKERVVQAVVDLVELRPILDKAIGESGAGTTGLSVEQKKRVTIAVEMVANPSILFLDEPTSGLDSRSARIVMRAIRRIAAAGRTVVCTIHQPSFEIFSIFDKLLLLKKGGWMVYCGDLGPSKVSEVTKESFNTAQNMISYFESCSPDVPRYIEGQNPAEYMLEVIGAGTKAGNSAAGAGPGMVDFAECFKASQMAKEIQANIDGMVIGAKLTFETRFAAPYWKQYLLSTTRWLQIYWRHVPYNFTRMLIVVIIAVLFGFNIFDLHVTGVSSLNSTNGALFAAALFTAAIQAVTTVSIVGDQKIVYYRELDSKTYSPGAYLFGLTAAELPWILAVTFFHTLIYYSVSALWVDSGTIVEYTVAMFIFSTMFNYYGQMLAAVMPTTESASLVCGASVGLFNLYSGFFLSTSEIPWPWRIFYYLCPARYGLHAVMPPQFWCSRSCIQDVTCNGPNSTFCAASDPGCSRRSLAAVGAVGPGCGLIVDVSNQIANQKYNDAGAMWLSNAGYASQPTVTVWDYWSISTQSTYDDRWDNVLVMLGFLVAFRLVTIYYLKFVKHIKR